MTGNVFRQLLDLGIDVFTTGNHIWDRPEAEQLLVAENRLLRPANYAPGAPGSSSHLTKIRDGTLVAVVNLSGQAFMPPCDNPFPAADREVTKLRLETPVIIVDFHAEATAEKQALAWFLDGRVSAVIGTHTHVQTADERVLPLGTAYITDVGMVGPTNSVIGVKIEDATRRFSLQLPQRFRIASGPTELGAAVLDIDPSTGKAVSILRLRRRWGE